MASTTPYPIRIPKLIEREIRRTVLSTGLSKPEAMRLAMTYGLPIVRGRLGRPDEPDKPAVKRD